MSAYASYSVGDLIKAPTAEVMSKLHVGYAYDGFAAQYTTQTTAWQFSVDALKSEFRNLVARTPTSASWKVLLEYPLYRLRRRIDVVIVTDHFLVVVELKVGEKQFNSTDQRQTEEYALDLRDFHEFSSEIPIVPILWCTLAEQAFEYLPALEVGRVSPVVKAGKSGVTDILVQFHSELEATSPLIVKDSWESGSYKPVPSVVEAATTLFSGHGIDEIARADAENLAVAAETIIQLIDRCQKTKKRALIFLTGVPGSGKTLAGLQVVHRAVESLSRKEGDVVYLSGNTPLVTVLRAALTDDDYRRKIATGERVKKSKVKASVRVRIQHIMDFLRQYLVADTEKPPHERAIVFDEAQRAWDAKYGSKKFNREASEPRLLMDIMSRHDDWSAIVALIGGGQEINTGENGVAEWGEAIRSLGQSQQASWLIFGAPGVFDGDLATANLSLGELPFSDVTIIQDLALRVPLRSYRSPSVSQWVEAVLKGDADEALRLHATIGEFPIALTRDLATVRKWLKEKARGERRPGLVASSGAGRLRAECLGVTLNASDGDHIAHWYLKEPEDVRSSHVLEITANEYTTQGLELDFVGLCWGGDMIQPAKGWVTRQFRGAKWVSANQERRRFTLNSYRVLLTRAREGLIIWVPRGDVDDTTRQPKQYNEVARFLAQCGLSEIEL